MNSCPKTVLSNSLTPSQWTGDLGINVVSGKLEDIVQELKARDGQGDVIAYGGVQMVQSLVAAGMVDELFLIVEPLSLGQGAAVFTSRASYRLIEAKSFESGHVILHYQPV